MKDPLPQKPVGTQLLAQVLTIALAGATAYRFAGEPRWAHATAFGIFAAAGAVLMAMSTWVLTRLDDIVTYAGELGDVVRASGITRYVSRARKGLVLFLCLAALGWLADGAISLLLFNSKDLTRPDLRYLYAVGYSCVSIVVLYVARVARLYLSLDTFRSELTRIVEEDKARVELMRASRKSSSPLTPYSGRPRRTPRKRSAS